MIKKKKKKPSIFFFLSCSSSLLSSAFSRALSLELIFSSLTKTKQEASMTTERCAALFFILFEHQTNTEHQSS